MRSIRLRFIAIFCLNFFITVTSYSQNCRRSDINGTTINLLCNQVCSTLVFQVPHLKATTNYLVNSITYNPYAYTTPTGNVPIEIYVDDTWSQVKNIGFNFCYYGNTFNTLLMGSNSAITFDVSRAGSGSGYSINAGGTIPNTSYAPNMIFGPYHDIDPSLSSANKKIEWRVECVAPNRRFIASYNDMPYFGSSCTVQRATHQMVLYESSGIIEVYIKDKPYCTGWNGGRAILGVQDGTRTQAVAAPGRNATVWEDYNTGYRFIPSGGSSRYISSQMFDMSGNLIVSADTATTTAGMLDLSFQNVCSPAGSNQFEILTTFSDCINPANQYIVRDTITLNRTNTLGATSSFTNTSCGPPSGTITVTVPSGVGTPPYSFVLDGGTPVVTPALTYTFTGVAAGPHTVVVTDASTGCSSTLNITVSQTSNITANTSSAATTCSGVNNGTITVSPINGSAPYSYVLDGGAPVSGGSPYTFTNLSAGNHTIVITDFSGCVSNVITVNVATGTGVTATTSATATSCAGATNGTITVNASGGVPPYTYQLGANPPQASNVFTGLASGTYTITVRDNVGCTRIVTRTVTAGSAILATNSVTATSCSGAANGSVTITPTNGTGPYTFVLDGTVTQTGATSTTFTNLSAGTHTIVITDNPSGCLSNTININIPAGPALAASVTSSATTCSGASNGTITVTPTNGTGPYEFSLDGGPLVSGAVPYIFTNVPAGSHTIQVTDIPTGCISTIYTTVVSAGPVLLTTASKTDVLCYGGATGTITVAQPSAGTAPYEYSLDNVNWQSSAVFTGLNAGTYTVYYRESNGCSNSLSITVNEPSTLTATDASTAVICNGQTNGTITVTANGGVSPYEFSIDGGANWQTGNIFTVAAGAYTVIIRDANGCTVSRNIAVTEPAVLTASSANTSASCDGGNDGIIDVTVTGGNGTYQYSIDGTNFQASNIFNVAPGNYTVTVRDNLGCTISFITTVGLSSNITFTAQTDPTICEGSSTQLDLVSNATQYVWTPRVGLSDTTIHNPVANPVITTQYIVTATLGRCSIIDTVIVNVNPAPIPDAGPAGYICYGQTYQLQALGGVQYQWTPATYLNNPNIANPVSSAPQNITYTVSIIADVNGCPSLTTDDITIDVTPPIKINTFPYDTIGYPGDQVQLLAIPTDNDATTFVWTPSTGLDNPFVPNPIVTIGQIGEDRVYQVTASTIAGCKGEGYVRVRVYKGPDIYVPSGFTPNGDGRNDRFTPFPVGIKSLTYFRIFNRWGQQIFSTNRLHEGWDGTLNGTKQPSGVYVWMIQAVTDDNRVINKKGTVTIIR